MKRKFLNTALLGLLLLAPAATTVSCSDYDDEINNLQQQIEANKSTITSVQTALESEIANLRTQLEARAAELQTAIDSKADASTVAGLQITVATLESRISATEKALTDLEALVNGKVDKSDYDAEVLRIYAEIAAVNTDLSGKLNTLTESLNKGLEDEAIAREALKTDLQGQIDALENSINVLEGNNEELDRKLSNLMRDVETLRQEVSANSTSIKDLKDEVASLSAKIGTLETELKAEISTLNVFVSLQLRSLVFQPECYYWGVEATKALTLNYVFYSLGTASADTHESTGYTSCARYSHQAGSTMLPLVAHYHMNPSTAVVPDQVTVLDDDKWFETETHTRSSAATMSVTNFEKNGAMLDVTYRFADPSKIKSVVNDSYITVFATQAKYASNGKDTTITSDYAAVYKSAIENLVISHTQNGDGTRYAGRVNSCDKDFNNAADNLHSINNCTRTATTKLHLIPSVYDAINMLPQDSCDYDKTLNLAKLVETHYDNASGTHTVMSASDLKGYGLVYRYELTASHLGSNSTSEAAHAGIKGSTFRPQIPQKDGKAYSYDAFTALNEPLDSVRAHAVGREPIVRVSLVDTVNNNRVLDYGYIKIKITEPSEAKPGQTKKPNVSISYTGDNIKFNYGCNSADYTFTTTWNQIEYDVLRKLGMHKEEFDANYERDGQLVIYTSSDGVLPPGEPGDVAQYESNTVSTTTAKTATLKKTPIGVVKDNFDANNPETSTFTWTIEGSQLDTLLCDLNHNKDKDKGKKQTSLSIAIRYKAIDQYENPDFYIILNTGTISYDKSTGEFLKADGSDRIQEYWYKDNANGASDYGKEEIHAQTLSPEDPNAGNLANVLDDKFSDVFYNNTIGLASVVDNTPNSDFSLTHRLYNFVFSSKNEEKTFKGVWTKSTGDWDEVTWTLHVRNDGKELWASYSSIDALVATIDGTWCNQTTVRSQKISYAKTDAAFSLLNYKAHNELADDVLKAIIALNVKSDRCEHELELTSNEFNVRFMRPITVTAINAELEDAQDQKQIIYLKDLVSLKDWREYLFASHANYWNYYNIKDIKVIGNYTKATNDTDRNGSLNAFIFTTMSKIGETANSLNNKVRQSTVSNQVEFRAVQGDEVSMSRDEYGHIVYENLSSTVQTFSVRLPIAVTYEWGSEQATTVVYVDVKIKNTHENAQHR